MAIPANYSFGQFVCAVDDVSRIAYDMMTEKGCNDPKAENQERIALIHSELSECLEALRHDNPPSEQIPDYSHAEEELADAVIRIMRMAHRNGWKLGGAIAAKMRHNETRPHKHGGKRF